MPTYWVEHTINYYDGDILTLKHHMQQIGISLTHPFFHLKDIIGFVICIITIANICSHPIKDCAIYLQILCFANYQVVRKSFDFLKLCIGQFIISLLSAHFWTNRFQQLRNFLDMTTGQIFRAVAFWELHFL